MPLTDSAQRWLLDSTLPSCGGRCRDSAAAAAAAAAVRNLGDDLEEWAALEARMVTEPRAHILRGTPG